MRRIATASVALLLLVAAACSSGDDDAATEPPTSSPTGRGGVLRIGLEPPQARPLHPSDAQTPSEVVLADLLYDGLTRLDHATGEAKPALAASWESSPDQRVFTFTLADDATFSDGAPVRPADIVSSVQRGVAREFPSTEIEAVGDDRVRITMAGPLADLPLALTSPRLGVAPSDERDAWSGPFQLSAERESDMTLVRARDTTLLDRIDVSFAESAASLAAFEDGALDWAVAPLDVGAVPDGRSVDLPAILFYGLNVRHPALVDVRVREAIIHAVNRPGAARAGYRAEAVKLLDGVVPEGMRGGGAVPCGERCTYDPDGARRLLAEAAPGGIGPVPVDFDDIEVQRRVAAAIVSDLRAIGIDAIARPHAIDDYAAFLAGGTQGVFRLGWVGAWPSVNAFLPELFSQGSRTNVLGFRSDEVDRLLPAVQRGASGDEAARLVLRASIVIPIAQFRATAVASDRVRDLRLDPYGSFDGSVVWLDD